MKKEEVEYEYEVEGVGLYWVIAACERYVGHIGDKLGNSLVIGDGMSVAGVLVLCVGMLDRLG